MNVLLDIFHSQNILAVTVYLEKWLEELTMNALVCVREVPFKVFCLDSRLWYD